jgi:hypothetical protein
LTAACGYAQGLVMLEKDTNKVVLLTDKVSADDPLAPDTTIDYINDVAIASNGIIYFSDSTQGITPAKNAEGFWDTMQAYKLSLFNVRVAHPTPFPPRVCACCMALAATCSGLSWLALSDSRQHG